MIQITVEINNTAAKRSFFALCCIPLRSWKNSST